MPIEKLAAVDSREAFSPDICERFMQNCGHPELCDDCRNFVSDMADEAIATGNRELLELASLAF